MGKLKKAGKEGSAIKYINRNRAIKRLQISLANFRRLCILKGVYPVEPKNRKKVNKGSTAPTTFYYTKDIQYLMHEPLLLKFREDKIFKRRLNHAQSKRDHTKAAGLKRNRPKYNLDHLILERYPTFIDAIRDIDDALSLLSLFSIMPSSQKTGGNGVLSQCKRLTLEFMNYVMTTNKLKKTFLSIKGIYYQAEISGQTVTWIAPYEFSQRVPKDVDFRVMWSFLEFYRSLIGFVNCKLYKDENLVYPPKIDYDLENIGVTLGAIKTNKIGTLEIVQSIDNLQHDNQQQSASSANPLLKSKLASLPAKIKSIQKLQDSDSKLNDSDSFSDNNMQVDIDESSAQNPISDNVSSSLFNNYTFFLSREVPKYSLEFVIRSFGGSVCWENYFNGSKQVGLDESDDRINIFIVDRPSVPNNILKRKSSRKTKPICLQPQFIYDCINAKLILSFDSYTVGKKLPPHLSPFVEYKEGDYVPKQQLAIDEYAKNIGFQGEVTTLETESAKPAIDNTADKSPKAAQVNNDSDDGVDSEIDESEVEGMSADEDDSDDDLDADSEIEELVSKSKSATNSTESDDDEDAAVDNSYQDELEAEFEGSSFSSFKKRKTSTSSTKAPSKQKLIDIENEKKAMAMTMMTKKNRKLYARMQNGIQNRKREAEKLNERRIEAEKKESPKQNSTPNTRSKKKSTSAK
ncbi:Pescadillo-like protein [Smittium culicis]|uniref:Pescadillo homolog n=1 Tax=Smittium culicis TaxID=133412 RepID=A0A1R1YPH2_9FUNG|nr:Pescadillo-like protein [Smittium culicis]